MICLERRSIFALLTSSFGYEMPKGSECLSFSQATQLIERQCPNAFKNAVQKSGKFLYRGESVICPTILNPPSDLLDPITYDNDPKAFDFFVCLEDRFREYPIRPSTGHIGTTKRKDAAAWGPPCSIWPLDKPFSFMWPRGAALLYPGNSCDDDFIVDKDLARGFTLEKEIMFTSPSFLVVPESYENDLIIAMTRMF